MTLIRRERERTLSLVPSIHLCQVLPYASTVIQDLRDAAEASMPLMQTIISSAAAFRSSWTSTHIMDDKDHDWYRVSGATNPNVKVTVENLSTTLRLDVKVYDANKSLIVEKYDGTPGANLSFAVDIKQPRDFYLEVVPYASAGKYRLRF